MCLRRGPCRPLRLRSLDLRLGERYPFPGGLLGAGFACCEGAPLGAPKGSRGEAGGCAHPAAACRGGGPGQWIDEKPSTFPTFAVASWIPTAPSSTVPKAARCSTMRSSRTRAAEAPWLVFVHGAGGSIRTWKYQIEAFRATLQVAAHRLAGSWIQQGHPAGISPIRF